MTRAQSLLLVAAAGAGLVSCTAIGQVEHTASLPSFRQSPAMIFDDARAPSFKSDRSFALEAADNPQGRIFAFDRHLVRITPSGRPGLWVRCADLEPGLPYCAAPAATGPLEMPRSGLPLCPGDPRCPRRTRGANTSG